MIGITDGVSRVFGVSVCCMLMLLMCFWCVFSVFWSVFDGFCNMLKQYDDIIALVFGVLTGFGGVLHELFVEIQCFWSFLGVLVTFGFH
jgi:hypothetical protein